jgi:hypothetical protein
MEVVVGNGRGEMMGQWRRAAGCVAVSCVCGVGFGVAAQVGLGRGDMYVVAAAAGGAIGAVCSPVMIFALWHGPLLTGLAWIVPVTLVAAFVAGRLTPTTDGPELSVLVSAGVYVVACLLRGVAMFGAEARREEWMCARCGYDLRGLREGVCPECGERRGQSLRAE